MGGVAKGEDAAQLMLAGASAVAVGTALFADPFTPIKVREGLAAHPEIERVTFVCFSSSAVPSNIIFVISKPRISLAFSNSSFALGFVS